MVEGAVATHESPSDPSAARTRGSVRRWRARIGRTWRPLTAVAAGLAQLLALPPYGLWPLAPLGAGLLTLAVMRTRARHAAWLGALSGAGLMVPLLRWQEVFGTDVWLLIAAVETVYYVPMAVALALVTRLPGWVVWTGAVWVAQELVRARVPLGGFPWGKLAFSQGDTPLTGYAALGSSALVSFMVAVAGGLLLSAAWEWRSRATVASRVRAAAGRLVVVLVILGVGALAPRLGAPDVDHTVTAGIVQGNVPGVGQADILGRRQEVLDNHVTAVHELAARVERGAVARPDFVVLPENASDIDPYADRRAGRRISEAARDVDAPLLFGVTRTVGRTQREIRSVVWDPRTGPGEYYVKRSLVPFGEYIPFRGLLAERIPRLERIGRDAIPGTAPGALDTADTTVAAAICFDVAFDAPLRESVTAGGQLIVVPTNNANYNFTGQPAQQLAITRLRAVEHGRAALVASTSGISAVVEADGTVAYRSPEARRDIHVAEVPAMSGLTPASRLGAVPEWALAALGGGAVGAAAVGARRHGRSGNTTKR